MPTRSSRRLVLIAVATFFLALGGLLMPMPKHSRAIDRGADLMHLPIFATVTFVAIRLSDRFVSSAPFTRCLTAAAVVFMSACIELVQAKLGRTASIGDLIANITGATAVLLFILSSTWWPLARWFTRGLAIAAAFYVVSGPVESLIDIWQVKRSGDQLATFDSRVELERWYIRSARVAIKASPFRSLSASNPRALLAKFFPGQLPTVQLYELNSRWTEYHWLQFDIGRPADDPAFPLTLHLRIVDQEGDYSDCQTYITPYTLRPGDKLRVRIPLAEISAQPSCRPLDLDRIRFLEFTAIDLKKVASIQLGNIRLAKD